MRAIKYTLIAMSLAFVAGVACLPPYKADPNWVRGTAMFGFMKEFNGDLVSHNVVISQQRRDLASISLVMRQSHRVVEDGLGATRDISYAIRAMSRSHCLEYLPGCLEIEKKNIVETIAIKTDL
jgi:hypothetical protein